MFVFGVFDDKLGQQLLAVDAAKLSFEVALKKSEAFERAHRERRSREVNAVGTKSNEAGASAHIDNRQCYRCGSRQLVANFDKCCLLYTSPSPRDLSTSRMPSSA